MGFRNRQSLKTRFLLSSAAVAALGSVAGKAAAQNLQAFTQWNFDTLSGANNTPAPTLFNGASFNNKAIVLGMDNTYTDSNGVTGSVAAADVTSTPLDITQTNGPGLNNAWRVRGPAKGTAGKNNGWNLAAPQYTQGAEFDADTSGQSNVVLTFDWFATNQGVNNMMVQYNTDVTTTNWVNVQALVASPNDYRYGQTVDFGKLGITGANNDQHFGVRLVSMYDPTFTDSQGHLTYTSASGGVYNNNSGNWRFANVSFLASTTNVAFIAPGLTWSPTSGATWDGQNSNWTDTNSARLPFNSGTNSSALFTDAGIAAGGANVNVSGTGATAFAVNVGNTSGTYTFSGGAVGGGQLTKTGAGTLALLSPNNFTQVNLLNGTLQTNADANLGTASARIFLNGGTLQATAPLSIAHLILVASNGATLDTNGFTVTNTGGISFSGPFVKRGAGDLVLAGGSGAGKGGTFTLAQGNVIFSGTTTQAVIIAPTAAASVNGNLIVATQKGLSIHGGIVDGGTNTTDIEIRNNYSGVTGDSIGGAAAVTINVPIRINTLNLAGTYFSTIGMSGIGNTMTLTPNAVISGNGSVAFAGGVGGTNTVGNGGKAHDILQSHSTYTGDTIINGDGQGIVQLGVDNALPVTTNLRFGDGANSNTFNATANSNPIGAVDMAGFNQKVASIGTYLSTSATNQIAQQANGLTNLSAGLSTLTVSGTSTTTFFAVIGTPKYVIPGLGTFNNIALTLDSSNTGKLTLQGNNDYVGLTTINGGTLQFDPAVLTIGSQTQSSLPVGNSIVNNASLVINSPASIATDISGSGTATVNGTSIRNLGSLPVTIAPALTANTLVQGALANNGVTTIQTSGQIGPVSGAGVFNIGDPAGGGTASATVGNLVQSVVNINNGAGSLLKITKNSGTSTVNTLNVSTGSTLDLTNNTLLVNYGANPSPASNIRSLLVSGYNHGAWNGAGITSTGAAAHPGSGALGYADASEGVTISGLAAGNVIVRYALYGDTMLRGFVDGADYTNLRNHFGAGNGTWTQGDFTFDGVIDGADYTALRNNFGSNVSSIANTPAAAPASRIANRTVTLTGGGNAATPAITPTLITPAAGTLELEVDKSTGHLYLVGNNTDFVLYQIASAGGLLSSTNWNKLSKQSALDWAVLSPSSTLLAENIAINEHEHLGVGGFFDLAQAGVPLWSGQNLSDLTFGWTDNASPAVFHSNALVQAVGVPEPTTISLLGLGATGLLARRRRKSTAKA